MAAKHIEILDPASAWLFTQDPDTMWRNIGNNSTPSQTEKSKSESNHSVVPVNPWAQSAEAAWRNIGSTSSTPPQLPTPSEYPNTINPFAIVKAGNEAWNHLSDSHPWSATARAKNAKLDAHGKPEMSAITASWQLIKAGVLQKGIPGVISGASVWQDRVISFGENQLKKIGIKVDLELPDPEFIGQEVTRIRQMYLNIDPKFVKNNPIGSISDPEYRIAMEAEAHAKALYTGSLDTAFPITPTEVALASQLIILKKMRKTPLEITEVVKQAVASVAGDIALQQNKNLLFARYKSIGEALERLSLISEPSKMFITDVVTSKIILTDSEEKEHGKRVWGLTPTNLVIRNISTQADNIIVPLSLLTKDKNGIANGILMSSGTPDVVDIIRRKATRFGQNAVFKAAGKAQVGGMVTFYSLERDKKIGEIVVDDPVNTMHHLQNLADTIRKTQKIMSDSRQTIREQETGNQTTYIRPNIVLQELTRQESHAQIGNIATRKATLLNKLNLLFQHYKTKGEVKIENSKIIFADNIAQQQSQILLQELNEVIKKENAYQAQGLKP